MSMTSKVSTGFSVAALALAFVAAARVPAAAVTVQGEVVWIEGWGGVKDDLGNVTGRSGKPKKRPPKGGIILGKQVAGKTGSNGCTVLKPVNAGNCAGYTTCTVGCGQTVSGIRADCGSDGRCTLNY